MKTKLFFFLAFLLNMVGKQAFAADISVKNDDGVSIFYTFISNRTELAVSYYYDYYTTTKDLVIPATVTYDNKNYPVTSIQDRAFESCTNLTSVTIPNSVITIGREAFKGCSGLTSVTIGNSVARIYYSAFYGCSRLTSVTIPNSVTLIEGSAFAYCIRLLSVTIPKSVTSIGKYVFSGCSSLSSIKVEDGNMKYDSRNNCNAIIETESNELISGCRKTVVPSSVTRIGNTAFESCTYLTSLTIPNSVTSIGSNAFSSCTGLTSVNIPNSVTSIGSNAFSSCTGLTSVNIPNSVTSLGESAFEKCSSLTSLCIPNSVTTIEQNTFSGCASLISVTIPNSVTTIGKNAFSGCSGLVSITIPNSVSAIGSGAFDDCNSLVSVKVRKDEPLSIESNTFTCQAHATLIVPIGSKAAYKVAKYWQDFKIVEQTEPAPAIAFANENVKAFCVVRWDQNDDGELSEAEAADVTDLREDDLREIFKENGILATFDELRFFTGIRILGGSCFYGCAGLTSVTIPNSVTSIGSGAFYGCTGLTSVTIPNSVTTIEQNTFSGCTSLVSVTIPNSVTSIGSGALYGCTGLTTVTIPNSVTTIEQNTFSGCTSLVSVTIPNSVTSIGKEAFYNCSALTSVIIPNSVTSIGESTFGGCGNLTNLIISDVAAWLNISFDNDSSNPLKNSKKHHLFLNDNEITDLVIPSSITSIKTDAFYNCSDLTSVTIPNSVTSIDKYAFYGCSGLTCVTIPNSVTTIGDYTFYGCSGLTSVTIPNSMTSIGFSAFAGCYALISVTSEIERPINISPNVFSNQGNATLYVCKGSKQLYQNSYGWNHFKEIIETLPYIVFADENVKARSLQIWDINGDGKLHEDEVATVTHLGSAFYKSSIVTFDELQYFTSLTSIEQGAFYGCSGLTAVNIPKSVTSIGDGAFKNCSALTSVIIPNSVTSIGKEAFYNCSALTSVIIPNSVTSIGKEAFYKCSGLTSVSIPNTIVSIERETFSQCSSLTSVTIPNSVTSIGDAAFYGCNALTSVTIPNSVTYIGDRAFCGCSGLTSLTIPNSVNRILYSAFEKCFNMIWVKVESDVPASLFVSNYDDANEFPDPILYVPMGSKKAYQRTEGWSKFKTIFEYPNTDVNMDGESNVVDVVDIARFVVGTPNDTFVELLADLNSDGEVNVADAVVLVNEIAGDQNFAKAFGAPRQDLGDDCLTLTENPDHSLSFSMDSQRNYTAFQFDLYTNSEIDVMNLCLNTARKKGHQILYNKMDEGHYRVAVFSTGNDVFCGNNGELLNLRFDGFSTSDVTACNIHFVTADGTDHRFDNLAVQGETTGINLTPNPPTVVEEKIYDLSGRRVSESSALPKGVYIVNGKKVMVK